MKNALLFTICFGVLLLSCRWHGQADEINAELFVKHFERQSACVNYIDVLLEPTTQRLWDKKTIRDIRRYIVSSETDVFAKIVSRVQIKSKGLGVMDPTVPATQVILDRFLYEELVKVKGFVSSGCGVDLSEILVKTLYAQITAHKGSFLQGMRFKGGDENLNQERILLASLLGGVIVDPN